MKKILKAIRILFSIPKLFFPVKSYGIKNLPLTFISAIRHAVGNRRINNKLKNRYYEKNLIMVFAITKSASTLIANCIAKIAGKNFTYTTASELLTKPHILQELPHGGVIKNHQPVTSKDLEMLKTLGSKYFILVRHPADQLTSYYCFMLNKVKSTVNLLNDKHFQDVKDMNEAIDYIINSGFLHNTLMWIVNWMKFRNSNKSYILKYEDIKRHDLSGIEQLFQIIMPDKIREECCSLINNSIKKYKVYPRGWTGKKGIWKDYFTEQNRKDYNSQVEKFLKYYPDASLLLTLYPREELILCEK